MSSLDDLASATLDAERGRATCRTCGKPDQFAKLVTVLYGGAVLFAVCLECTGRGEEILVRRGPIGVEILRARQGGAVVRPPLLELAEGIRKRHG